MRILLEVARNFIIENGIIPLIPIGMEWCHSIPIGMECCHSIPIGMECHSLPILKKYAAGLVVG